MPSPIALRRPSVGRVHDAALFYVAAELSRKNVKVNGLFGDSGIDLIADLDDEVLVRVKGKTSGQWQAPIDLEPLPGRSRRLIVFVDLDPRTAPVPAFWIAPEKWVLRDIRQHHASYLAKHGGRRPKSPKAKHHSISSERLMQWRDRWDLFDEG